MIKVQPQGQIYLCKTPLESDYKNQLTFTTIDEQQAYFLSTVVKSYDENTYIRKDGGIKIGCNAEEIRTCNYMFYRNTGFDNRIYYCFITNIEYRSENSCFVSFETDCFQTWYFDLEYKPCFVEREHVDNDTIGLHTVPEGLETGDLIQLGFNHFAPNKGDITWDVPGYEYEGGQYMIAFQVTELTDHIYSVANVPQNYNGIYSGLFILGVDNASDALNFIRGYSAEGKGEAIVSCFITYPHFFKAGFRQVIGTGDGQTYEVMHLYPAKVGSTSEILKSPTYPFLATIFDNLNGYTPKNNKLKTYPYCAIVCDNNGGQTSVYKPELFPNNRPYFAIYGAIGQGNSAKLVPYNYNNDTQLLGNYQEGLQAYKLPVCAYKSDYYLNWVTQNAINMNTSVLTSAISGTVFGGMYRRGAGAVTGGLTSGLLAVIDNIAKTETAKIMPDQAKGNVNVSDLNIGYFGQSTPELFSIKAMCVKAEYARIIDNFFTMFGYKVNVVKTPSITGRSYWNYVKTIDCNIEGNVPQEDLQVVRNIFNNGCTFWHGAENMYNYNLNNSIVS